MADGYARVTGKPAACFIISGPGMTNISTAMGEAYADSVPMLVISSVNKTADLAMGEARLHELNSQRNLIAGVSAFSHTLMRPDELPRLLARAFAIFYSARPRPVHIEIPLDIIGMPADHIPIETSTLPNRPAPTSDVIKEVVKAIGKAEKPVIFIGGGSIDAGEEIMELLALLDVPVATTVNARGLLPVDHPNRFGIYHPLPFVEEFVSQADLIFAIGTEFGEPDYCNLFNKPLAARSKLIRIDIDPEQLMRTRRTDISVHGDAKITLQQLNQALKADNITGISNKAWLKQLYDVQTRTQDFIKSDPAMSLHKEIFSIIDSVTETPIIMGDNTQPVFSANLFYEARTSRSYYNSGTGFCTLGYALPAAIGAKLALPERTVIAMIGDGGLMFTLSELATATEEQLPIIVILWNNQGYGEIKKCMINADIKPVGVDLYTPDFKKVMEGFGCRYTIIENLSEFQPALASEMIEKRPLCIELTEHKLLPAKQNAC